VIEGNEVGEAGKRGRGRGREAKVWGEWRRVLQAWVKEDYRALGLLDVILRSRSHV